MLAADLHKIEILIEKVRNQLGKAHIQFAVRETSRSDAPFSIALSAKHFTQRIEPRAGIVAAYLGRGDFTVLVKEIRQGFLAVEGLLQRARADELRVENQRSAEDRRCGWDRRGRPGEPPPVERRSGTDRRADFDRRKP